jgi:glyoxylate reductase
MAHVLITRALPGDAPERLRAAGHEVDVWPGDGPPTPEELRERAAPADGLICLLTDRVDAALLDAAPRLRVVANLAVGSDNVDLEAARARGVAVGVTPDVLTDATADLALGLLLAAGRRLVEAAADVRAGRWRTWEPQGWLGLELRGARLLVVGGGRIGRAVARRAEAFGMDVRIAGRDDHLLALLEHADAVSLHVPLTDATRHLIGAAELEAMKPTAILVNTARGPVVDQVALREALHEGRLGAAALDVTDPEPLPADDPLLDAPRLLVVPHIGSATHAAREAMAARATDNLLAGLAGQPLPHPAG